MISTGSNGIMMRQDTSMQVANPCGALPAPRWVFAQPTPLLIQKGLSATVLQQELEIINAKSADSIKDAPNYTPLAAIPCVLIFVGFALFPIGMAVLQDFTVGIFGFVMFGVCGFVTGISCMFANAAKMKAYATATQTVRTWVEVNLNEKYQQPYGIRWNISEERVTVGSRKHRRTVTYCHIVIQCVDAGGAQMMMQPQIQYQQQPQVVQVYNPNAVQAQPQQIMYVDQHGNPINPQQMKVVQIHVPEANANGPSTASAPPAYAPQEASAPGQGHTNY
mmetsp:Transcript_38473/g.34026  ORF Transcript_38473/g.34026 Transcript_38473/m.34026 type:complete len:278 (+) Transcript_38473:31-864(+)|eukprot:CAMPEP_0201575180 /NCGR_PEP_ID=MMETSP0190_2-20130828/20209_1 /ASSEMBLY_ACC=CAM_ASM_000263 /TAXON_ID=37353 /ORGANISM="Rosalina sp." /LENGTH=277 /DNA_ID=CAMNT_0048004469 /DNA_START=30 /DNA_END=863 /DNA_ORIENTATION=-